MRKLPVQSTSMVVTSPQAEALLAAPVSVAVERVMLVQSLFMVAQLLLLETAVALVSVVATLVMLVQSLFMVAQLLLLLQKVTRKLVLALVVAVQEVVV